MGQQASALLSSWSTFYVMLGSSAAALTGLMFVVITLINRRPDVSRDQTGIATSTFSTPTVLHFCAVLLLAATISAPWRSLTAPGVVIAIAGLYGVLHVVRVIWRARRLTAYVPDLEDVVWYEILPLVGYLAILSGAVALFFVPIDGLFVLAGGAVLLTFVGIRNSWDAVTWLAIHGGPPSA